MKRYYIYALLLLLSVPNLVFGQEETSQKDNIVMKGNAQQNNTIRLRWAPTTPKAWAEGKKYGYVLEKYLALKDGKLAIDSTQQIVVPQTFLPAPLDAWRAKVEASDYAAVIAQSFYGEDFMVSSGNNSFGDVVNQATELQQRFATSVFMAGYDYEAAELAGWAWTDTDVEKKDKYFYRVRINKPTPERGDTAIVLIGMMDKKKLPKPIGLNSIWGDKAVMLSWNNFYQADTYHSYHVERASASDKVFKQITDMPITPMGENMQEMFYTDSLPNNDVVYRYRIRGVTSFDELGPYSDEISGQGKETVSCIPEIVGGEFVSVNTAMLSWEFECNKPSEIAKLAIKQSTTVEGEYKIVEDNITVSQRSTVLNLPDARNYLKVYAYTKDGKETSSFPYMLRQVDSIPPAIPVGLKAEIDTLGVAHLSWTANKETDLRGYRILRAFTDKEEKSSITDQILKEAEYTDTLSLALSNKAVYYSITALDEYYNESQPSETIVVYKPDNSLPDEPVITASSLDGNKVTVSWVTDTSRPDVEYYLVRSNYENARQSKTVFSGNNETTVFTDELVESGTYNYKVTAVARNGKKTFSPQPVVHNVVIKEELNISGFNYFKNEEDNYVELTWVKHPKATLYRIYKSENDKPATLLKELEPSESRLVDEQVSVSTKYVYTIMFRTADGMSSKSKNIIVNY